jgi:hypothetical protein
MSRQGGTTLGLLGLAMIAVLVLGAQAQARSAATVTLTTHQSEFSPGSMNMGWWDENGEHSVTNDNYIVGEDGEDKSPFRDFFSFDGKLVTEGCATSAALKIPAGTGSGDFGGVDTLALYVLHDVSTPASSLKLHTGPDLGILNDLGTGKILGLKTYPTFGNAETDTVTVPLNGAGLAALNAAIASDRFFSVGGMIAHEPDGVALFAFTPVEHPHNLPVKLELNLEPC